MDSSPKKIFVSYVEEDGDVAHEIAKHLEAHGYSSWYYERDCPAGADYFEETFKAISDCEAMAIIISPRSLPSDQITREIVRAVEANKATLPLLLDLTHDEYAHRRPGWKQAMAAANATRLRAGEIPGIIPALVAGLHAKGIRPHGENTSHTVPPAQVPIAPQAPAQQFIVPPSGAIVVPPQPSEVAPMREAQVSTSSVATAGRLPLIPIAAGVAVVIAALAGWHFLKPQPKAAPPPPAPVTATIMLKYAVDRHMCTPDVNMTLAGKTYHLSTAAFAASEVPKGLQHYTIDGMVSCPGHHTAKASGGGDIDVREGAVFDMTWQSKPGGVGIIDVVDAANEPAPTAPSEPVHANKPAPAPPPAAVAQPTDPAQPLLVKANTAYVQGRYFEPANDSALHWAILAGKSGSPAGKNLELQLDNLFRTQLNQFYQQQNYPAALHLVNLMRIYYPSNAELIGDQQKLLAVENGGPAQQLQMGQAMQQMLNTGQRPPGPGPYPPGAVPVNPYQAQAQARAAQQRAAQNRPH